MPLLALPVSHDAPVQAATPHTLCVRTQHTHHLCTDEKCHLHLVYFLFALVVPIRVHRGIVMRAVWVCNRITL